MTSQQLYVWHYMHCIWHHIHSLGHHTTLYMTSSPLYLTTGPLYLCHSHPPYRWYHSHYMYDITSSIYVTSYPLYLWYISTKYDITTLCVDNTTLGICITSFALQMTSHPLYHTKPQYLWCHTHFRHDNTAPVSDIAPTLSVSSHRLHWHLTHFCMTSHPPSMWHHMHYI